MDEARKPINSGIYTLHKIIFPFYLQLNPESIINIVKINAFLLEIILILRYDLA
jgi:hypothetical protein